MKKIFFLLTLLCYISCKTNQIKTATYNFNNEQELIVHIDSCFAASQIPGLSYAVVDENGILFERSFGYSDISAGKVFTNETIINIASISKTIIAVAMMKAVEEGYVSLDEDINTYLPFKVNNPNHPNIKITLRQLATHTSSIQDSEVYHKSYYFYDAHKLKATELGDDYSFYYEYIKDNELIDDSEFLINVLSKDGKWYNEKSFSKRAPGVEAEYSNIAATLAAYVIECATKTKYEDYTAENIFNPLGMKSTTWEINEQTESKLSVRYFDMNTEVPPYALITKADGGLYTSISDFSKYMIEMIKGFKGQGSILSNEGYKTMLSAQLAQQDNDNRFNTGLFWDLPSHNIFGHDGGDPGVTTRTTYNGERQRGLIFFSNVEGTKVSGPGINKIWDAVALYDWK